MPREIIERGGHASRTRRPGASRNWPMRRRLFSPFRRLFSNRYGEYVTAFWGMSTTHWVPPHHRTEHPKHYQPKRSQFQVAPEVNANTPPAIDVSYDQRAAQPPSISQYSPVYLSASPNSPALYTFGGIPFGIRIKQSRLPKAQAKLVASSTEDNDSRQSDETV